MLIKLHFLICFILLVKQSGIVAVNWSNQFLLPEVSLDYFDCLFALFLVVINGQQNPISDDLYSKVVNSKKKAHHQMGFFSVKKFFIMR